MTCFQDIYDAFFTLITDDMYADLSEEMVKADCDSLLMASLPLFEFPDKPLNFQGPEFDRQLTLEEVNILAMGMVQIWAQRQVTSIELMRQKVSGQDFRMTSQASHLQRCMALLESTKEEHRRLQMLYSRREVDANGNYQSSFHMLRRRRRATIPRSQRRRS